MRVSALNQLESATAAAEAQAGGRFVTLRIDQLEPDRNQPRTEFAAEELQELAESLRGGGLAQPLVVRPSEATGMFTIIMGERRWRAASLAGLAELPAVVRENLTPGEVVLLQLAENSNRVDPRPLETARGYKKALDLNPGLTQTELARRLGKTPAVISRALSLLDTDAITQKALEAGDLRSPQTAIAFAKLPAQAKEKARAAAQAAGRPIAREVVERLRSATPADAGKLPMNNSRAEVSAARGSRAASAAAPQPAGSAPRGRPSAPAKYLLPKVTRQQLEVLFRKLDMPLSEDLENMPALFLSALTTRDE